MLLHERSIDVFIVPFTRKRLLPVLVDRGGYNGLDDIAAARGCREAGECCVLLALQKMEFSEDIEDAVRQFFV